MIPITKRSLLMAATLLASGVVLAAFVPRPDVSHMGTGAVVDTLQEYLTKPFAFIPWLIATNVSVLLARNTAILRSLFLVSVSVFGICLAFAQLLLIIIFLAPFRLALSPLRTTHVYDVLDIEALFICDLIVFTAAEFGIVAPWTKPRSHWRLVTSLAIGNVVALLCATIGYILSPPIAFWTFP